MRLLEGRGRGGHLAWNHREAGRLGPSPELRVEDAGGVKAAKPVFLSLSLLFATPNKRLKFFQQELQIMEIPIPGGTGGAELQGRVFEWCIDHDTRQVHCRRAQTPSTG